MKAMNQNAVTEDNDSWQATFVTRLGKGTAWKPAQVIWNTILAM